MQTQTCLFKRSSSTKQPTGGADTDAVRLAANRRQLLGSDSLLAPIITPLSWSQPATSLSVPLVTLPAFGDQTRSISENGSHRVSRRSTWQSHFWLLASGFWLCVTSVRPGIGFSSSLSSAMICGLSGSAPPRHCDSLLLGPTTARQVRLTLISL